MIFSLRLLCFALLCVLSSEWLEGEFGRLLMKVVMGSKVVPAAGWRWPACHGCPLTAASDGQDEARDHVASSGEFSTLSFTGPGKSYSQDFSLTLPPPSPSSYNNADTPTPKPQEQEQQQQQQRNLPQQLTPGKPGTQEVANRKQYRLERNQAETSGHIPTSYPANTLDRKSERTKGSE